ncbi:CBS domain-containing protein [Methanobrevibacter filiformis]|uniref:Inosine-5'-monophosphate dehydrogenase n=1 Tax=Methanobrevibacter filiformis TaxID=55758 RepID=A0A165ZD71_9EURY|nr:CBS domain-containing protein [Methanobrevibacter filiformis]KZX10561.1 inosine-5'-monophosphate dehydrogenase [Methanobrevibacter filiformis]
MLKNIKVKELMTKDVITISPDDDVVFAFEKLMKNKISALPVIDNDKNVIGIVTASDLGHNLILDNYKLGTKVSSVMAKEIEFISPESNLYDALSLLENNKAGGLVNQLPVIENNKIVGIISDGDVIKAVNKVLRNSDFFNNLD